LEEQGEGAFMMESENQSWKITGYTLPREGKTFVENEVRNTFLAQAMTSVERFEDNERVTLTQYLDQSVLNVRERKSPRIRENNLLGDRIREVYKYKAVALKVKPVVKELPAEFRIKREIVGDPLAEMPELSTSPPEFAPTERYTQERKISSTKCTKGNFYYQRRGN
jgi:hypothetical protein